VSTHLNLHLDPHFDTNSHSSFDWSADLHLDLDLSALTHAATTYFAPPLVVVAASVEALKCALESELRFRVD